MDLRISFRKESIIYKQLTFLLEITEFLLIQLGNTFYEIFLRKQMGSLDVNVMYLTFQNSSGQFWYYLSLRSLNKTVGQRKSS